MKKILLLACAYLNGGALAAEGATVSVGEGKAEITAGRAADLVKAGRAEDAAGTNELDGLTVADLKTLASVEDVDLGAAKTRAELIAAIRANRAERDEA